MTREEAIKYLKKMKDECNDTFHKVRYVTREEALDMAIKTLEQEPNIDMDSEEIKILQKRSYLEGFHEALKMSVKQEPCEDCVSRKEVFETFGELLGVWGRQALMEMPPVTPKPKTGHWINIEDRTDWYDAAYKCSCCGREIITPYELKDNLYSNYPYCHCGAKMESEETE